MKIRSWFLIFVIHRSLSFDLCLHFHFSSRASGLKGQGCHWPLTQTSALMTDLYCQVVKVWKLKGRLASDLSKSLLAYKGLIAPQTSHKGPLGGVKSPILIHHVQPCHYYQNNSVNVLKRSCFCINQLFLAWIGCGFSNRENWNYKIVYNVPTILTKLA